MKFLALMMTLSFSALAADIDKRPNAFPFAGSKAVFADFTKALYKITYDVTQKKAFVEATIDLTTVEEGHVVFDLHVDPTSITIDGDSASSSLVKTPDNETTVRILSKKAEAGDHELKIQLPLTQLVEWTDTGVKSAFWMSDLTDRGYLERYLPTNYIYDRIPMTFVVKFIGVTAPQTIYANAQVETLANGDVQVTYPENLNTTCQYFHTVPASTVVETRFSYKSVDGRDLPVVIYFPKNSGDQSGDLNRVKSNVIKIMDELEKDYGPFLHPSLTVYINGSGGMEYSGATMTSESALGHELFHSYFARGVMPSDGNSGWIDEALARWRDNGYQTLHSLAGTSQMANHGHYTRATDRLAYTFGERFMALLDGKIKSKGGLKIFLREAVEKKSFDPISVPAFIQAMDEYYGMSFEKDFKQYVFGEGNNKLKITPVLDHDIHRQHTMEELKNLL